MTVAPRCGVEKARAAEPDNTALSTALDPGRGNAPSSAAAGIATTRAFDRGSAAQSGPHDMDI